MATAKKKPVTAAPGTDPTLAALVDELGELEAALTPMKPKLARIETIRKQLRGIYNDAAVDKAFTLQGSKFAATIGARSMVSAVNVTALIRAVGSKVFASIASVTLKRVQETCSPAVYAACVSSDQSGPRPIDVFPVVSASE